MLTDDELSNLDPVAFQRLARDEFLHVEDSLYQELPTTTMSRKRREKRKDILSRLAMTKTARLSSEYQQEGDFATLAAQLEQMVANDDSFQSHYNAACFYSVAISKHIEAVDKAVGHFREALERAGGRLSIKWAVKDPDLTEMFRRRPGLKTALEVGGVTVSDQGWARRVAWALVRDAAEKRAATWTDRQGAAAGWSGLQFGELRKWASEEDAGWYALAQLSLLPQEKRRQLVVWKAVSGEDKLPAIAMPEPPSRATDDEISAAWGAFADRARYVKSQWDEMEDKFRSLADSDSLGVGVGFVSSLCEATFELWRGLGSWAAEPAEDSAREDWDRSIDEFRTIAEM
jgi:hypothetical protein